MKRVGPLAVLFCLASWAPSMAQSPIPYVGQPLVPASAVPSGPGFTLTVNGAEFVPGATVNWNGLPLATTFVSGDQLTAAVPVTSVEFPGTAMITVVNPGSIVTSNVVFFPVTTSTATVGFVNAAGSPLPTGSVPHSVAIGDFNKDGKVDLAVANWGSGTVTIYRGNGDGTFTPVASPSAGAAPASVTVGDFNGDGNLDLAVADAGGNGVTILLGNGDGTFNVASFVSGAPGQTWISPWDVAVGDFNGDGNLDLAIPNFQANDVTICLGHGDGMFTPVASSPSTGIEPWKIAVGDFNKDGNLDLAVLNQGDSSVTILLGKGDGTFETGGTLPTPGIAPYSIAAADFEGDGNLDLAVAGSGGTLTIFTGHGDGTFSSPTTTTLAGGNPVSVAVGDLNGDGKLDLAIANYSDVTILLGNGDGTFTPNASSPATGDLPYSVALGDFNGDGRLDLATANLDSNNVSVSLQPLLPPTGTISVTTNLPAATFIISGPETFSGSGTAASFYNAPVGTYTVTFGAVTGYVTPVQQKGALTSGGTLRFDVAYTSILLQVSPSALAFSYTVGSPQAESQVVTLSSNVPSVSFTATAQTSGSNETWLTVQPSASITPAVLTISAAPGMQPGSYSGQVLIQSGNAINSPLEIPVTLTVTAGGSVSSDKPIVLIVPGILGTKLASTSEVVWLSNEVIYDTQFFGPQSLQQLEYDSTGQPVVPLSTQAIQGGLDYGGLFNLSSDSGVLAYELVCAYAVRLDFLLDPQDCDKDFNVYNSLVSTLATNGYTYEVFPYDWRQDISVLADSLAAKIASMQIQYPGRSIAIIAHSMGGLVVGEMFAKHGIPSSISHVITMGTPFLGSVHTYLDFRGWGSFYAGIKDAVSQAIGANWTSAYELLPQWRFVHLQNGDSPQVISIYDGSYSEEFPALPRSAGTYSALTSAQAVWNDEKGLPPIAQAYAIIGTGIPTSTVLTDIPSSGTCLQVVNGDGDGEVPLHSALGSSWVPSGNVGFVNEQHAWLPENSKVLRAIIDILAGKMPTTLSAGPTGASLSPSATGCLN